MRWPLHLLREEELLQWMLDQRRPTAATDWGDLRRQVVAAVVVGVCQPTSEDRPYGCFRPHDPFAIVSSVTVAHAFAESIEAELGVVLSSDELFAYEAKTLGQVVEDLAGRALGDRYQFDFVPQTPEQISAGGRSA
jgi:hypothetical protein